MSLTDLEKKYFEAYGYDPAGPHTALPPIYRGSTDVQPLVDGATYYPALHAAISATSSGDAVYIVGYRLNPGMDLLTGDVVSISSSRALGHLLASRCAAGVDVRLVLNGTLALYWVEMLWGEVLATCETLRTYLPPGETAPPLADRVLFDWSGSNVTGSQHQKTTVVRTGTNVVAFIGGMDLQPMPWDTSQHERVEIPASEGGGKWGWHDMGVRLEGEGAKRALHNFRNRWAEAASLPERHWKRQPGDENESPRPFNPKPILATPAAATPGATPIGTRPQSVQVLRARYKYKIPNRCGSGGVPWAGLPDEPAVGGFFEIYATLKKAIAAARRYIYVEDQFLNDMPPGGQSITRVDGLLGREYSLFAELLSALNHPDTASLRVVFVGSGRKDPEEPGPTARNTEITTSIQYVIDGLPAARQTNVAVWRRDRETVHSKLVMIDDEFVSIGSANFQSRSMAGVDNELNAAIVAEDDLVKQLRIKLWSEHFNLNVGASAVSAGLDDLDVALGLWRADWYAADTSYWTSAAGHSATNGYGGLLSPVVTPP